MYSNINTYTKYSIFDLDMLSIFVKSVLKIGSSFNSFALGTDAYNDLKSFMLALPESKLGPIIRQYPESIIYANSYYYLSAELAKDEIVKLDK